MSFSLYQVTVPTFKKGLQTLDHILAKAEAHAKANNINPDVYVQARLIADQLPLAFQVQNSTKTVKVSAERLSGTETAALPEGQKTIADLRERVKAAVDILDGLDEEVVNGRANAVVGVPYAGASIELSAADATLGQGLPNFFFHINVAYSILRAQGVPLGKLDYISNFLGRQPPA